MLIMEFAVPNGSNETTIPFATSSLQYNASLYSLADILVDCNKKGPNPLRVPILSLILITILPANIVLLWLLVKNRRSLSPSEVLGLNFAILGVLFCLSLPLDIGITITNNRSGLILSISNTFATLSYFGCPLLLTSMCLERYVAVAHPVLFLRLGKWEYRAAYSGITWLLTCIISAFMFVYKIFRMALVIFIILNMMFLVMLASLLGIIWALFKKGPGEGDQNNSSVKKRALKNVVAVLLPSTIIYLPLLAVVPYLLNVQLLTTNGTNALVCDCLTMFSVLPSVGVCIGPMFYLARLRRTLCRRNNKSEDTRKTTTGQKT